MADITTKEVEEIQLTPGYDWYSPKFSEEKDSIELSENSFYANEFIEFDALFELDDDFISETFGEKVKSVKTGNNKNNSFFVLGKYVIANSFNELEVDK